MALTGSFPGAPVPLGVEPLGPYLERTWPIVILRTLGTHV